VERAASAARRPGAGNCGARGPNRGRGGGMSGAILCSSERGSDFFEIRAAGPIVGGCGATGCRNRG
jgi:hypothetical protein